VKGPTFHYTPGRALNSNASSKFTKRVSNIASGRTEEAGKKEKKAFGRVSRRPHLGASRRHNAISTTYGKPNDAEKRGGRKKTMIETTTNNSEKRGPDSQKSPDSQGSSPWLPTRRNLPPHERNARQANPRVKHARRGEDKKSAGVTHHQ